MSRDLIKRILNARLYDVAIKTPLQQAPKLSSQLRNRILLKREDLQPVFSFKIRGAYCKLAQLDDQQRQLGVITASAGNHAQGLALAAQAMDCPAIIVMPVTTPDIKIDGVRARGAQVVLHGDTFSEALSHALSQCALHGLTFIHPYDDLDVIAGQGTIGLEILEQCTMPDAIFVPVGGGGLIAGIAAYIKYVSPQTRVIGVEPEDSNCLQQALQAGQPVPLAQVGHFADGVAVSQVGKHTFELCRRHVDQVITVNDDEICAAIKSVFEETRSILEPSGALAVAGIKRYVHQSGSVGQCLVAINSGANINFDRLRHVAERAELGQQREALCAVTLAELKGSFWSLCELLEGHQLTELGYRRQPGNQAQVFLGVQTHPSQAPRDKLIGMLASFGFPVQDLTDNELAKTHVRHMIGGRSQALPDERIVSFDFPERPGALFRFLEQLDTRWDISLFHYRNHGAAQGRVLMGLIVPPGDEAKMREVLDAVGHRYQDETDNPAYQLFLGISAKANPGETVNQVQSAESATLRRPYRHLSLEQETVS
ncbi:threonine ammonia-lyase, biosynthetic [Pseudomonas sp. SC11]|uniref:threonine ammonia-lyase, biosynthetic n=1 Tax=Pseudomonas sp. SC11 TaxID=326927 RepID=UPI00399BE92F